MAAIRDGLVDFTAPPDPWGGLDDLTRDGWVRRNWERGYRADPQDEAETDPGASFAEELAAVGGPICEIAAGPGGGFMPRVRYLNREARIMVNDRSPGVVALWRDLLASRGLDAGLCFAAFDATKATLRPGCLAAVSSRWGFGNIDGPGPDPEQDAVGRMAEALRPGGLLFAMEGLHDSGDWAHLPEAQRHEWESRFPLMGRRFADRARRAGLEIVREEIRGGRALVPDEGGVPTEAARYGITLHIRWEYVKARKP